MDKGSEKMLAWATRMGLPFARRVRQVRSEPRPGRNEPCRCGSGKKYKRCCQRTDR